MKPRVRFAPSPTGALHIGGVRTALYNYLFAKKHAGTFVLRIEDTDQKRFVKGAEAYIMEALAWCGISPDEGVEQGGDYGPYRQSERQSIYAKYAFDLLEKGHAYYAFDTEEELEKVREEKSLYQETFMYGVATRLQLRNSLALSQEETQALLNQNTPYTIRLKMPADEVVVINDIIRGKVTFQTDLLDDKVILKTDGLPTYHLANVVDDHLMEITHVIRGEEWLPSTGHHVLMYQFFGWEMPQFAHLPLILKPSPASYLNNKNLDSLTEKFTQEFIKKHQNYQSEEAKISQSTRGILLEKDKLPQKLTPSKKDNDLKLALKRFLKSSLYGKLSKRDGDRLGFPVFPLAWKAEQDDSFQGFRETGFLPAALVNFLVFLGWSAGTEQEIFSLEELIENFSLERIGKAGAKFDFEKAKWFNQQYLIGTPSEQLAPLVEPLFKEAVHDFSRDFLVKLITLFKERVQFLPEFLEKGQFLIGEVTSYDEKTIQKNWKEPLASHFGGLIEQLSGLNDFQPASTKAVIESFVNENNLKFGQVMQILRVAIAGTKQGPDFFEMLALLGQSKSINRLEAAAEKFDALVG